MLRTIQYSFPSKADGLEISCLAVVPELERNEKYRGIIQIVHGMSEYKERYIPFMEYMAERKYISAVSYTHLYYDYTNSGDSQSSAFVDFTLQASQNGEVLEGTYPEASDDAVDNYMSTIDPVLSLIHIFFAL